MFSSEFDNIDKFKARLGSTLAIHTSGSIRRFFDMEMVQSDNKESLWLLSASKYLVYREDYGIRSPQPKTPIV